MFHFIKKSDPVRHDEPLRRLSHPSTSKKSVVTTKAGAAKQMAEIPAALQSRTNEPPAATQDQMNEYSVARQNRTNEPLAAMQGAKNEYSAALQNRMNEFPAATQDQKNEYSAALQSRMNESPAAMQEMNEYAAALQTRTKESLAAMQGAKNESPAALQNPMNGSPAALQDRMNPLPAAMQDRTNEYGVRQYMAHCFPQDESDDSRSKTWPANGGSSRTVISEGMKRADEVSRSNAMAANPGVITKNTPNNPFRGGVGFMAMLDQAQARVKAGCQTIRTSAENGLQATQTAIDDLSRRASTPLIQLLYSRAGSEWVKQPAQILHQWTPFADAREARPYSNLPPDDLINVSPPGSPPDGFDSDHEMVDQEDVIRSFDLHTQQTLCSSTPPLAQKQSYQDTPEGVLTRAMGMDPHQIQHGHFVAYNLDASLHAERLPPASGQPSYTNGRADLGTNPLPPGESGYLDLRRDHPSRLAPDPRARRCDDWYLYSMDTQQPDEVELRGHDILAPIVEEIVVGLQMLAKYPGCQQHFPDLRPTVAQLHPHQVAEINDPLREWSSLQANRPQFGRYDDTLADGNQYLPPGDRDTFTLDEFKALTFQLDLCEAPTLDFFDLSVPYPGRLHHRGREIPPFVGGNGLGKLLAIQNLRLLLVKLWEAMGRPDLPYAHPFLWCILSAVTRFHERNGTKLPSEKAHWYRHTALFRSANYIPTLHRGEVTVSSTPKSLWTFVTLFEPTNEYFPEVAISQVGYHPKPHAYGPELPSKTRFEYAVDDGGDTCTVLTESEYRTCCAYFLHTLALRAQQDTEGNAWIQILESIRPRCRAARFVMAVLRRFSWTGNSLHPDGPWPMENLHELLRMSDDRLSLLGFPSRHHIMQWMDEVGRQSLNPLELACRIWWVPLRHPSGVSRSCYQPRGPQHGP